MNGGPLDRQAVEELRDTVGDGAFGAIVALYEEESSKLVGELREAVTAGDVAAVAARAHKLQSSSTTVGARSLARVCRELEQLARRGILDSADELSRQVESLHASSVDALARERSTPTA